jgi:hypothetical protein
MDPLGLTTKTVAQDEVDGCWDGQLTIEDSALGYRRCAVYADCGMRDSRAYARSLIQEAGILSAQSQFKKGASWAM